MMVRNVSSFTESATLSDEQIRDQIRYCGKHGWAVVIEHTLHPDPGNHYWERWGLPILDPDDPEPAMFEVKACREAFPDHHIRVNAWETGNHRARIRHSILVQAPDVASK